MSNPLVRILVNALRDAGNANGAPIATYMDEEEIISQLNARAERVHQIIADALRQVPPDAKP